MKTPTCENLLNLLAEINRPEVAQAKNEQVLRVAAQTGLSSLALRALFAQKAN